MNLNYAWTNYYNIIVDIYVTDGRLSLYSCSIYYIITIHIAYGLNLWHEYHSFFFFIMFLVERVSMRFTGRKSLCYDDTDCKCISRDPCSIIHIQPATAITHSWLRVVRLCAHLTPSQPDTPIQRLMAHTHTYTIESYIMYIEPANV